VEEHCEELARRQQFLRRAVISEWPDGTVTACYGFRHAVYQHLWHERVTVRRRQQWHQRIDERKEAGYGERVAEVAAELAVHFEQGRDYRRAIRYLQLAAESVLRRSAHQEAILLLSRGLELLKALPDTSTRIQQELTLQIALGAPLVAAKGYASQEVEEAYTRARQLCQQVGSTPQLLPVLRGLWVFYLLRAELQTTYELGEQLYTLAQSVQDPALLLEAQYTLGASSFFLGEPARARTHLEQCITFYEPQRHASHAFRYG
jgi:predicted ATPase